MSDLIIKEILELKEKNIFRHLRYNVPFKYYDDVRDYFVKLGYMCDKPFDKPSISILGCNPIDGFYGIALSW